MRYQPSSQGTYSLKSGSGFDLQRNSQRKVLTDRQIGFINKAVEEIKEMKKDIKIHCKKNLDRFKVPTQIIIKDKIEYSSRFKKKLF